MHLHSTAPQFCDWSDLLQIAMEMIVVFMEAAVRCRHSLFLHLLCPVVALCPPVRRKPTSDAWVGSFPLPPVGVIYMWAQSTPRLGQLMTHVTPNPSLQLCPSRRDILGAIEFDG